jgi:hypothetical protein
MERTTNLDRAKKIMGKNFIGLSELLSVQKDMGIFIPDELAGKLPEVNFPEGLLSNCRDEYLLILGSPYYKDETPLTIKKMRDHFGFNPELGEPCFYNQDWYINEDFFNKQLDYKWYLLRKSVIDETRAKDPDSVTLKILFPSAVLCAYMFFVCWHHFHEPLWSKDYIWCSDHDHNGDRIYVGRYIDPHGINKNGFSIHRHLSISNIYGCINVL